MREERVELLRGREDGREGDGRVRGDELRREGDQFDGTARGSEESRSAAVAPSSRKKYSPSATLDTHHTLLQPRNSAHDHLLPALLNAFGPSLLSRENRLMRQLHAQILYPTVGQHVPDLVQGQRKGGPSLLRERENFGGRRAGLKVVRQD